MDGNSSSIDVSDLERLVQKKTEEHESKSKSLNPNFALNNRSDVAVSGNSESNNGCAGGEQDLCYENNATGSNDENNTNEANDIESALRKREYAIAELLSTEELYIKDLAEIVNGYIAEIRNPMSEIPIPEDLQDKKHKVFGNIIAIYEWHRDYFSKQLQRCQKTPTELGSIIKRYRNKLKLYIIYCQNKQLSEHIVNEHFPYFDMIRQKLGHRLYLSDMLIKPVQRIGKYELLFRDIAKHTERAGLLDELPSLEDAYRIMKEIVKTLDDAMVLCKLINFDGKISAQGDLLNRGQLTCIEDAKKVDRSASMVQKPRVLQVFLFSQSIIFAEIDKDTYNYYAIMQLNKMALEELPNNRFLLKSTDPHRPDFNMICYAETVDLNRQWVEMIKDILKNQHDFLKAITSPIDYQKQQQQQQQKEINKTFNKTQ